MKILLSLVLLIFVSLVNAEDIAVSSSVEHCSMDAKTMNMSSIEHLSKCNNTGCVQHFPIDKKVVVSEKYIVQSLLAVSTLNNFYTSFSSKMPLPPPIV